MAILFVAADAVELKPFVESLTAVRRLKWPIDYAFEGISEGRRMLVAANGAGPALAARAVETAIRAVAAADLSSSRLEAVVSTGFCGALDDRLREGAIIVADEVLDLSTGDGYKCVLPESASPFTVGPVVSQNKVAIHTGEKKELGKQGACAVEMEAAGVAARTIRAGLPFCCIKVVSDRADESFGIDLNQMRSSEGRLQRGKIIRYAVAHPARLPELFKWKHRSEDASRALGEFLVSCGFRFRADGPVAEG